MALPMKNPKAVKFCCKGCQAGKQNPRRDDEIQAAANGAGRREKPKAEKCFALSKRRIRPALLLNRVRGALCDQGLCVRH